MLQILSISDLVKAHVKAHFRKDTKTGKLIFIADYDDKRHKDLVHKTFARGHRVKVNNPKSKHHGKMMTVTGYSDKYDEVGGRLDGGGTGLFKPHHLDHDDAKAATPASTAPAAPTVKTATTLDNAVSVLGLQGLSYMHPDMKHELKRVDTMTDPQLIARISKVKSAQKLYNFQRALVYRNASQAVKDAVEQQLIDMANATPAAKVAPKAIPTPAAAADPNSWTKGEAVEVLVSRKHAGKQGVVLGHNPKYGVRVKFDDGSYGEFKPDRLKRLDGTQAPQKPDEEPQPAVQPTKSIQELFETGDRTAAYVAAKPEWQQISHEIGILPVDDESYDYMRANLNVLIKKAKWVGGSGSSGSSGAGDPNPQWARHAKDAMESDLARAFLNPDRQRTTVSLVKVMDVSDEDWRQGGYDVAKMKESKEKFEALRKAEKAARVYADGMNSFNAMFQAAILNTDEGEKRLYLPSAYPSDTEGFTHRTAIKSMPKRTIANMPIGDLLRNDSIVWLMKRRSSSFLPDKPKVPPEMISVVEKMARGFCGIPEDAPVTVGDIARVLCDGFSMNRDAADNPLHKAVDRMMEASGAKKAFENFRGFAWGKGRKGHTGADGKCIFSGTTSYSSTKWDSDSHFAFSILAGRPTTKYVSHFYEGDCNVFNYPAGKTHNAFEGGVTEILKENPDLNKLMVANAVLLESTDRWKQPSKGRSYENARRFHVLHKKLFDLKQVRHDPVNLGMMIARRSGTIEAIHGRLTAEQAREARKWSATAIKAGHDAAAAKHVKAMMRNLEDKKLDFVRKKFDSAWDGKTHSTFKGKVTHAFQIGGMEIYEDFKKLEKERGNVKYMYHGTDFAAASNIVKTGFMVPKKSKAGKMLGPGVYVTPVSSKSAQYLHEGFSRRSGARGVMFLNKCVMGNNQMLTSYSQWSSAKAAGKHAVGIGKGVGGILNEEHCIYDPKALIPVYWLDVKLD